VVSILIKKRGFIFIKYNQILTVTFLALLIFLLAASLYKYLPEFIFLYLSLTFDGYMILNIFFI